jgi:hypothetical protein
MVNFSLPTCFGDGEFQPSNIFLDMVNFSLPTFFGEQLAFQLLSLMFVLTSNRKKGEKWF